MNFQIFKVQLKMDTSIVKQLGAVLRLMLMNYAWVGKNNGAIGANKFPGHYLVNKVALLPSWSLPMLNQITMPSAY